MPRQSGDEVGAGGTTEEAKAMNDFHAATCPQCGAHEVILKPSWPSAMACLCTKCGEVYIEESTEPLISIPNEAISEQGRLFE